MPDTRYARNGDLWIAYQVWGDGPVDLIMVLGAMTHLEQNQEWPGLVHWYERIASFCRLIVFDKRGNGLSDRILSLGAFEETATDIAAVMKAASSEKAFLLGQAEGAPQCMLFAATYPEQTLGLILFGAYPRRVWAPDYPWGYSDEAIAAVRADYEKRYGREPLGIRANAPSLADDERFVSWYTRASRYSATPGAALAWFDITNKIDVRSFLPAIRVPTLVAHREDDRVAPIEGARWMAERIHGARFVALSGSDHFVFTDDIGPLVDEIEQFVTCERQVSELNRVLATILFTDIVESTRRAAAIGDRLWKQLIEKHHRIVRAQLARFGGTEIDVAGDGFLATFDGPSRAVRSAQAIHQAVKELGIEIRVGLHTGEIERRDEGISGIAVHIGARIMARAEPGEVLASSTVKDLVAGSGIEFTDRGSCELSGVPGTWQLFAVNK